MLIVDLYPFILEALAGIGRLSIGKLKGVLLHPNLNVRLSAIAALGKTNDPSAVDLLVPILDSTDVEERISAIVALGELRAKSATEKVVASLKDGNPVAREKGVYALMKINDPSALPALEYMARTDRTLVYDRPMQTLADLAEIAIKKIRKTNSQ